MKKRKSDGVAVVIRKDREYLMIQQSKEPHKGNWGLVHGTIESDENEENAVKREVFEEVGIKVKIIKKIMTTYVDNIKTSWWLTEYESGKIKIDLSEISKCEYVTLNQIFSLKLFLPTREFLQKHKDSL